MGAYRLLWTTSRPLAVGVALWGIAQAGVPALVVVALGVVVGRVDAVLGSGFAGPAEVALASALVVATGVYTLSLVLDPIGAALGTAARSRLTGALQARLLRAVAAPVGVGHLEDPDVLDRLSRAEGTLSGLFPGDAPVTWAGAVAARASGLVGCAVIALHTWWVGLGLAVMWLGVRQLVLGAVVRQATDLRGQTPALRRAWYFAGLGTKAPAAKEARVFGLAGFLAEQFRAEYATVIAGGRAGLRLLRRRAVAGVAVVLAGVGGALLALLAGGGDVDVTALATLLPMFGVTMALGTVSYADATLRQTLAALPDLDRLERDLAPGSTRPAGGRPPPPDVPGVSRALATGLTPAGAAERVDGRTAPPDLAEVERGLAAVNPAPARPARPVDGRPRRALVLEGVRFAYPNGEPVLDGVDLELPAGTSTAVVGVNGAGKTTLVSLLSRLREPDAGRVLADGVDLRDLDAAAWQRGVAVVFQEPARYPLSAYDNVALGAVEHAGDRAGVEDAAERAGFLPVLATLPAGWDTVLTRELPGGVDLSGGQWQRLALARALFATRHGARVLVLDEPTAALDVRAEAAFYDRFLDITRGLTTVVISHRFATVRRAQQIVVLDGGRITERGTHDDLVAAGGTYASMYTAQAERFA